MVNTVKSTIAPQSAVQSLTQGIVFIDSAVFNVPHLLAGVMDGIEAIVLDPMQDGVRQISQVLAERQSLTSIHLVSHGAPGKIFLGTSELSLETLSCYCNQLQQWAEALSDRAELLIYGCEVAKGDRGEQFIRVLSEVTGATVAASSTKVGNPSLGGNWDLDVAMGSTFYPLAFSSTVIERYEGALNNEPVQYNLNLGTDSSNPINFTDVNGTLYFNAYDSANGRELWKIDPTTGNPVRVVDIEAGAGWSNPTNLTNANSILYFSATNGANGNELWKIDPTTGNPVRIEIEPGTGSSVPTYLTNVNGTLYFSARNSANGTELWKIDPATGNPVRITDIEVGAGSSVPTYLTNVNGTLYFSARNSANGTELWKIDPATGNPVRIEIEPGTGSSSPQNLTNVNGTLYFSAYNSANGTELWKIDPATGNPVRIEIEPGAGSSNPYNLTNVNGTLYFSATNSTNGTELWKIDPATGNPVRIEIETGISSSFPAYLTNVNGTLYFNAYTIANGRELWKIDPATGNPVRIEIEPGAGNSNPYNLTNVDGTLYFSAYNSTNGTELWKIDPDPGSPVRITDIEAGAGSSGPNNLTNVNGTLYFSATNSAIGTELWKLNSFTGDLSTIDVNTQDLGSSPFNLTNVNGTLYFSAYNSANGYELWKIDPATGNPVRIEIEPGTGSSNLSYLTNVNGILYFSAYNSANGYELWKIDSATGNPVRIEIEPGAGSSNPSYLTNVNGILYFSAYDSANGYGAELWKIDPATGNPVRIEIEPGAGNSNPYNLTNVNGTLYFSAYDSSNGDYRLWKIDPTTGSPMRVTDTQAADSSSNPSNLTNINGTLYFSAYNSANGAELWKIDSATGNPVRIEIEPGAGSSNPSYLTNVNGTLYFSAYTSTNGAELWKIDPATGNPVRIEIEPGTGSSFPQNLTNINGTLYFSATNSTNGTELWKIDPATGNPVRIEIEPGAGNSNPYNLTNVNSTLYFSATNSTNGRELWRISPDTNAPELVVDFNPDAGSSNPSILGFENGKLYLSADNGVNGSELWMLDVVNDAPILSNINKSGSEDTTIAFTLGNFTTAFNDADGNSLSKIKITALPTDGVLMLGNNAVALNQEIAATDLNTLKFIPDVDFNGTVSFSWNGFDGTNYAATPATVTLTINSVNDAPALTGAQASLSAGTEDTAYIITDASLLKGYSDVDDDVLSVANLTASNGTLDKNNDGTWTFTPKANFNGTVNLTYDVVDGNGGSVVASQSFAIKADNDVPTGSVTIVGTAKQGETLTASNSLDDADGLGTISYQWQADGVDIAGATGENLILTQALVGKTITVTASYTDDLSQEEFVTSTATTAVKNVNDLPTGSITITGTSKQGETLTAANTLDDADGLGTISYQWQADGVDIAGATGENLTLTQALVGKTITVTASYSDGQGTPESVTSAATTVVKNVNDLPTGSVTISGTAKQGETLSAINTLDDADGLGTIFYQWQADGVDITGATSSTLLLNQKLVGKTITVTASYTDGFGKAESVSSAATLAVKNVNDLPTGSVTITGTAKQGETLSATNTLDDADGLGTLSYQWQADGVDIAGATGSTLVLDQALVGKTITVTASYTDDFGKAESVSSAATTAVKNVNDLPTGSVTVSGTAKQGETLTVSNTLDDVDGLGSISYQWQADGVDIAGATGENLVLTQALVGKTITVTASYTDDFGKAESVSSAATTAVKNVNDLPTGSVTISGTAKQGETLTVSNTLDDADGVGTISYQWQADGVDITGATGSTLVLDQKLVGKTITVAASYTDDFGQEESVTAAATTAVKNVNDLPTGSVTISGTAKQGETLTASNTLDDVDGLGSISYQWQADGVDIAGATGENLILTQALVGKTITVTASYNDDQGTPESVTSAATEIVISNNVDTIAPDAPSINPVATDNIVNSAEKTAGVIVSGTAEAGSTVKVAWGDTVLEAVVGTDGSWSQIFTSAQIPADDSTTISATATDAAGNTSAPNTRSLLIDTLAPTAPVLNGFNRNRILGTVEANATVLLSTSASSPTSFTQSSATASASGNYKLNLANVQGAASGKPYYLYSRDTAGNLSPASTQQVVVGTDGADTLTGVGGFGRDLLVGGAGADRASYAVTSSEISRTGSITTAAAAGGTINIATAGIDMLTGIETVKLTNSDYTGLGNRNKQLRKTVQTTLTNNAVAAFVGNYKAATGAFTFGEGARVNATLIAFDANAGDGTNYEAFLALGRTNTNSLSANLNAGAVSLSGF